MMKLEKYLTDKLEGLTISTDFYQQSQIPTITKLRVISRNQQLIRLDFEEDASMLPTAPLFGKNSNQVSNLHRWLSCRIMPREH